MQAYINYCIGSHHLSLASKFSYLIFPIFYILITFISYILTSLGAGLCHYDQQTFFNTSGNSSIPRAFYPSNSVWLKVLCISLEINHRKQDWARPSLQGKFLGLMLWVDRHDILKIPIRSMKFIFYASLSPLQYNDLNFLGKEIRVAR